MEDLRFEAEFLTWDQASQNSFTFACHLTSTIGIRVSWDPFNPDWIASAANADLAQVMIDTQHLIHIQLKNEQKWAKVVEVKDEGKLVKMRTENGDAFMMKTEGQDTTTGYPILREAINLSHPSPTIAANRAKPHIWHRGEKTGQAKDRMGPSDIPPPSSTTGVKND